MSEDQTEVGSDLIPVRRDVYDGESAWQVQQQPAESTSEGIDWTAHFMPRPAPNEEMASLREAIEFLDAHRTQDEAALRAALLKWSDQVAQFRAKVESLEVQGKTHRAEAQQAIVHIEERLTTTSQALRQVQGYEQEINRLREESAYGAQYLKRINEEQILALNQLMSRITGVESGLGQQLSDVQSELGKQREHVRSVLIAVSSAALAAVAAIVVLVALFFPR